MKDLEESRQKARGGVNGKQETTKIEGVRPRQASEAGSEFNEAARPSPAGG